MLYECEKYGLETGITWNPDKTVFCKFGRNKKESNLEFCNEKLIEVNEFKYLGVLVSNDLKCEKNLMSRIAKASYSI